MSGAHISCRCADRSTPGDPALYEVACCCPRCGRCVLRRRNAKPAVIRASAATATGAAQGIHPAATRNLPAAAMRATSDRVESRRVICESYEGGLPLDCVTGRSWKRSCGGSSRTGSRPYPRQYPLTFQSRGPGEPANRELLQRDADTRPYASWHPE
jgi:hypothetical protein